MPGVSQPNCFQLLPQYALKGIFQAFVRFLRVTAGCSMSTGYFGVKSKAVALHLMEIADTVTTCLYVWGLGFQINVYSCDARCIGLFFPELVSLAFSCFYVIMVHLSGCDCACSRLWSCKVWACCGLQLLLFPTFASFAAAGLGYEWWPISLAVWEVSVLAFLLCRACRNPQELGKSDGEIDNFSTIQRRSAATEVPFGVPLSFLAWSPMPFRRWRTSRQGF